MEVIIMRKFFTQKNTKKLYTSFKKYLIEVLKEEEYLNTLKKCYEDAKRVKCYGNHINLTVKDIDDWLRGLPLATEYMTYKICKMAFAFLGLDYDKDAKNYKDEDLEYKIDCTYWNYLAIAIYFGGRK